jgi:hypothetical protein
MNYGAQTVKFPTNSEYRILLNNATSLGTWNKIGLTGTSVSLAKTLKSRVAGVIEYRSSATATKAVSLTGRQEFQPVADLKVNTDLEQSNPSLTAIYEDDVVGHEVLDETGEVAVECTEYVADKYGTYKKVKFVNYSTDKYQIYIYSSTGDTYSATNVPTVTVSGSQSIAAATQKKDGTIVEKKVTIAVSNGQRLFIRRYGDNKKMTWTTDFVGLGTVKFPAGGDDD